MKQAIGMIETQGLIGLIEAADVMLKSSNVHLMGSSRVGGGINTVMIEGDVAAVETAIQSAKASVILLGSNMLISGHVIPRPEIVPELFVPGKKEKSKSIEENQIQIVKATPSEQCGVDQVKEQLKKSEEVGGIAEEKKIKQSNKQEKTVNQKENSEKSLTVPEKMMKIINEDLEQETIPSPKLSTTQSVQPESKAQFQEKIQKMKVADLRKLAKEQKGFSRPKKEIYHMSKAKLIQALIDSLIINE